MPNPSANCFLPSWVVETFSILENMLTTDHGLDPELLFTYVESHLWDLFSETYTQTPCTTQKVTMMSPNENLENYTVVNHVIDVSSLHTLQVTYPLFVSSQWKFTTVFVPFKPTGFTSEMWTEENLKFLASAVLAVVITRNWYEVDKNCCLLVLDILSNADKADLLIRLLDYPPSELDGALELLITQ